jgi:hypothetical protein
MPLVEFRQQQGCHLHTSYRAFRSTADKFVHQCIAALHIESFWLEPSR